MHAGNLWSQKEFLVVPYVFATLAFRDSHNVVPLRKAPRVCNHPEASGLVKALILQHLLDLLRYLPSTHQDNTLPMLLGLSVPPWMRCSAYSCHSLAFYFTSDDMNKDLKSLIWNTYHHHLA